MAPKSKSYWNPSAKGHLHAAGTLSKSAPNLTKSGPVVQRKLASFRVAAKLAAPKPIPPLAKVTSPTPDAKPVIQPMTKGLALPKMPTNPTG
jgi:hypothetical protein